MIADSLFNQRSYKEAMEIYEVNFESGIYSTSMLLKMAFIAEGIGDSERFVAEAGWGIAAFAPGQ